jgi:hypothetical protein
VRLSLNTPVVAIDALPVGPAAAGIAVHAGARGLRLTLALRSVRSGQTAFFAPADDWSERHGCELGVDAALSFAESMGFLFEDGPMDPRAAAGAWCDFCGATLDEEGPPDEPDPVRVPLLSKFRFLAAVSAAGRLASPLREPVPAGAGPWLRLLSRF